MERAEAEAIYDQGRETVIAVLVELAAENALLRRQVAELSARIAKQDERIAELERRLDRNSRNSSLPPQPRSAIGARAPASGSFGTRARCPAGPPGTRSSSGAHRSSRCAHRALARALPLRPLLQ